MERLKQLRTRKGYSQQELASRADVAQHTISEIELGRRKPHGKTLRKLAAALGVDVLDLTEEPDSPKVLAPPSPEPAEEERRVPGGSELALEVGVRALGLPAADALRPILRDHASWARALGERIRTADDRFAALEAVGEEGERLESDFERAEAALPALRRELMAEFGFPADGSGVASEREAKRRAVRGHPAGEEKIRSVVRAFVDDLHPELVFGYQRKGRTLAHLRAHLPERVTDEGLNTLLAESSRLYVGARRPASQ